MPFPSSYGDAAANRAVSAGRSDEFGLWDIHVRNDVEVLVHEEDSEKDAVVGQDVV